MTVCIAAICRHSDGSPMVVGASDRMITVGDVQFEPYVAKVFPLTSSIFMLTASASASVSAEIVNGTKVAVAARLKADESWMSVEEAARLVGKEVRRYTFRLADEEFLEPLGLTRQSFLQHRKSHWFQETWNKLFTVDAGADLIVAGVDESGAHVWKIDGRGKTSCHDPVGYAASGIGQRHADAQFQAAPHFPESDFGSTVLLAYKAKRRSEVAPGVGRVFTDISVVMGLGGYTRMEWEPDIKFLETIYQSLLALEREVTDRHKIEMHAQFKALTAAAAAAAESGRQQAPEPSDQG